MNQEEYMHKTIELARAIGHIKHLLTICGPHSWRTDAELFVKRFEGNGELKAAEKRVTEELPVPLEKIRRLIDYSFHEASSYEVLTEEERSIISEEEYRALLAWSDREEQPPRKVPAYGRKKVDELMGLISNLADQAKADRNVTSAQLMLSVDNFLILDNMLEEMDRHLPDFFEDK
jgi:hypothetical protein